MNGQRFRLEIKGIFNKEHIPAGGSAFSKANILQESKSKIPVYGHIYGYVSQGFSYSGVLKKSDYSHAQTH